MKFYLIGKELYKERCEWVLLTLQGNACIIRIMFCSSNRKLMKHTESEIALQLKMKFDVYIRLLFSIRSSDSAKLSIAYADRNRILLEE